MFGEGLLTRAYAGDLNIGLLQNTYEIMPTFILAGDEQMFGGSSNGVYVIDRHQMKHALEEVDQCGVCNDIHYEEHVPEHEVSKNVERT